LTDLEIDCTRIRRAATGALLIEIPGEDTGRKADLLADRLREAFVDMGVRVSRPARMAELRITRLDNSISTADVAMAIGEVGGTSWLEIKTGEIRRTLRGMGALWVRCPLEAAIRVAEQSRLMVVLGASGVAEAPPPSVLSMSGGGIRPGQMPQLDG